MKRNAQKKRVGVRIKIKNDGEMCYMMAQAQHPPWSTTGWMVMSGEWVLGPNCGWVGRSAAVTGVGFDFSRGELSEEALVAGCGWIDRLVAV